MRSPRGVDLARNPPNYLRSPDAGVPVGRRLPRPVHQGAPAGLGRRVQGNASPPLPPPPLSPPLLVAPTVSFRSLPVMARAAVPLPPDHELHAHVPQGPEPGPRHCQAVQGNADRVRVTAHAQRPTWQSLPSVPFLAPCVRACVGGHRPVWGDLASPPARGWCPRRRAPVNQSGIPLLARRTARKPTKSSHGRVVIT